jgi:hypothetical protein
VPYSGLPVMSVVVRNGSGKAREWRCAPRYLAQRVGERLSTPLWSRGTAQH